MRRVPAGSIGRGNVMALAKMLEAFLKFPGGPFVRQIIAKAETEGRPDETTVINRDSGNRLDAQGFPQVLDLLHDGFTEALAPQFGIPQLALFQFQENIFFSATR